MWRPSICCGSTRGNDWLKWSGDCTVFNMRLHAPEAGELGQAQLTTWTNLPVSVKYKAGQLGHATSQCQAWGLRGMTSPPDSTKYEAWKLGQAHLTVTSMSPESIDKPPWQCQAWGWRSWTGPPDGAKHEAGEVGQARLTVSSMRLEKLDRPAWRCPMRHETFDQPFLLTSVNPENYDWASWQQETWCWKPRTCPPEGVK
jgi:hypothetical protein